MSTIGYLALGYGLIWAIIGAYVWFVSRRQAALRRQLDGLQVEVDEAAEKLSRAEKLVRQPVTARDAATAGPGAGQSAGSGAGPGSAAEAVPEVAS